MRAKLVSLLHNSIMDTTTQPTLKTDTDDLSASYDLASMDPEQRQKVEEELKNELAKVSTCSISINPDNDR